MDLIARKKAEMADIKKRSDESQNLAEVRALGETLSKLAEEIADAEAQLANINDNGTGDGEGDNGTGTEGAEGASRATVPTGAQLRNAQVVGAFAMGQSNATEEDPHDTPAYRAAFMEYVCRSTPIPMELRATTTSADAGAVIPTTILNEIIQKMESYGNVYALVRKLDVQGGVAIPILSLKPEASWIGENKGSDSQKLGADKTINFSYFGVECKISQTLLVNVTTLAMFQQLFVPLATEAIVKAVEIAIFKGNGTTQPTGILNDERIPEENVITITPEEMKSWKGWHTAIKAKMKKAYRNGTFFMNQSTFDGYIDGMEDENGQPVGRTNYGINGEETYRFMGKAVETVEDECIAAYDDANENEVIAVFMKPTDYGINSNLQMTTVKWVDNDSNEVKNKCILICDGKLIDPNGVLIIKKGVTAV